jgi:agmatinase
MPELRYRPAERAFLGTDGAAPAPGEACAVIIPFGLEASVTFGGGTANGPEAIIAASPELEFFDEELWTEPNRDFGIATLDVPAPPKDVREALGLLAESVGAVLAADKFPLTLGGEHTLTGAAVRPFLERYPDLALLQIDAHLDLRDSYQDNPLSHACAMRRVLDAGATTIVSAGIRNVAAEEAVFLESGQELVRVHYAKDRTRWALADMVVPLKGRPIYVSFDVDGFDASLMPATGTPEPGGLFWDEAMALLRAAAGAGRIVGADVVELAPIPGLHACDFTAAKLAYKLMSYALGRSAR